jgi:hypothetical protein
LAASDSETLPDATCYTLAVHRELQSAIRPEFARA